MHDSDPPRVLATIDQLGMDEDLEQAARQRLADNKSLNLGPFLLAVIFDSLLCGVLLMQGGRYAWSSGKGTLLCKLAVAYVICMNLAGSMLTWVWIYDLFVHHFGTYYMFLSTKYISWFFVLNSTTVVVVQTFFGWRAWMLMNRNWYVAGLITALVLGALGGGIAIKVVCSRLGGVLSPQGVRIPAYICMSCTVAADSIITGIILFYLLSNRSKGSQRATRVVDKVVRVTFESQLPPTLAAIVLSVTYLVNERGFLIVPILVIKLKSYGISFLHTLNSRQEWEEPPSRSTLCAEKAGTNPTIWNAGQRTNHTLDLSAQPVGASFSVTSIVTSEQGARGGDADPNHSEVKIDRSNFGIV